MVADSRGVPHSSPRGATGWRGPSAQLRGLQHRYVRRHLLRGAQSLFSATELLAECYVDDPIAFAMGTKPERRRFYAASFGSSSWARPSRGRKSPAGGRSSGVSPSSASSIGTPSKSRSTSRSVAELLVAVEEAPCAHRASGAAPYRGGSRVGHGLGAGPAVLRRAVVGRLRGAHGQNQECPGHYQRTS